MSNKDQVRRLLQKKLAQKQNLISAVSGLLGDGSGNVTDTSKANHVFVRISGIVTSVFNVKVPPENDLRVMVGNDPTQPNLTQVLSTFTSSPGGTTGGGVVGYAPASQYEWMGPDPIFIDKRLILPRRISTYSGMQVKMYADMFWTGTDWISIPIIPDPIDLSDYIPATAGKVAIVLITLNTAGETVLTDGTDVDIADLVPADVPAVPEDTSDVLAAVRVYYGQTVFQEAKTNTDIVDLRFTYFGPGSDDSQPDRWIGAFNYKLGGSYYQIGLVKGPDERHLSRFLLPAVIPGSGWEADHVKDPWLVDVDGVLWLFYAGAGSGAGPPYKIGVARSWDGGGTWTKYASNPINQASQAWESASGTGSVEFPVVLYDRAETDSSKRWKMWYGGDNWGTAIGYAYSADGLSWTKYAGNPILAMGDGHAWHVYGVLPRGIVRLGNTYYLFFSGANSTSWQGGYVTFTDPEGTYTESADNPILTPDGITSTITSNVLVDATTIAVTDGTIFPIGASVWVYNGSTHYLTTIISRSGNTLTVSDAAPAQINASGGAVRSVAYSSVFFASVFYDGGWQFGITGFEPGIDANVKEISIWGYSIDLKTIHIDYGAGCIVPITLAESQNAEISAENLSLIQIWRSDDRFGALPTHAPVTITDTATIDLSLSGQDLSADLINTAVVAGSYTRANITVDAQGRITTATDGASAAGELIVDDDGNFLFDDNPDVLYEF
ncbi:MAG: hypothetical protein IMZ61_03530 [Planctomycetes bacterium]|nr:hypothetical protein [Planctomycetota bacterium]